MKTIATCLVVIVLSAYASPGFGQGNIWSVWVDLARLPHAVTVAPGAGLAKPWTLESGAFTSLADAWKRACWLTKNGGIYGQKFEAQQILTGEITCDNNCNCSI